MQRVTTVRYTTKPGRGDENEALSRAVFAELRSKPHLPIAYAVLRDGEDFLHVFLNFAGDDAEILTELPSFKAFAADGAARWTAPPVATRDHMQLLEAYGFEKAMADA